MCSAVCPHFLLSVLCLCWAPWVWSQDLRERDALCSEDGCFAVYFQRKTFLDSWRSCKEKGGNLATIKRPEEASLIRELFSGVELRGPQVRVQVWIGLQRQPRQCSATRPLRGFTWITGDQDTQYTNWLREDSPNTCAAPRCVVMSHSTAAGDQRNNFKWLDGSCSLPVDGFLCRYNYKGMCQAIQSEGEGPVLYTTPFDLLSTLLTHVPFGSMASMPCPDGTRENQSVLCIQREDGTVGWSKEGPLCTDAPNSWCEKDNGGCEHYCLEEGTFYFCECSEGFLLAEDGQSCVLANACLSGPCEFECQTTSEGYHCVCPEGYLLAPDGRDCLDVDECLQSPCPHLCVNAPGTFECRCSDGYHPSDADECMDVDECLENPCAHACENTPGSHTCHCHLGFTPSPEDPSRCQDIDECQIARICQQMCFNYEGGFECYCEVGYELQPDHYSCVPIPNDIEPLTVVPFEKGITSPAPQIPDFSLSTQVPDWFTDNDPFSWLTEQPSLEWLTRETRVFTDVPTEEPISALSDPALSGTEASDLFEDEHSVSVTPTTDWFLDESTPSTTPASASTPGWGAQHGSTPAAKEKNLGQGGSDRVSESGGIRERASAPHNASRLLPASKSGLAEPPITDIGNAKDKVRPSTTERHTPLLLNPLASFTPTLGTRGRSEVGSRRPQDKSWLLVALLVPLSIFVVVMLALGIVYCTRCAVKPRKKSVTDCYRWISSSKSSVANTTKSRV